MRTFAKLCQGWLPHNERLIAVQGVVQQISEHFGEKVAFPPPPGQSHPSIPKFGFTPHSELRVSTFADSESTSVSVGSGRLVAIGLSPSPLRYRNPIDHDLLRAPLVAFERRDTKARIYQVAYDSMRIPRYLRCSPSLDCR